MSMRHEDVHQQYRTTDLLRIRRETHERFSEQEVDLHAQSVELLDLVGDEALLDVGCGPGDFLRSLRGRGHRGRLAGLDQSAAMMAEAAEAEPGIEWVEGQADALPFADGEFGVISARHMLYHVPDIPAALREFARVVGKGGVVLAATNGPRNTPGLAELETAVAHRFNLREARRSAGPFSTANAPGLLRAAFPVVEERILTNALVFTEAKPIVDYLMTLSVPQQAADDPELFRSIRAWATVQAEMWLYVRGGVWRDPKSVGLYRCVAG
ncbi:class I SAM-dependent methyltransferase [Actinospica robiniae]|uniref:class I SAM-dependent methyltransferase n=1 Tax=Actinospica robiniae TaxID=304901 RepID=UPI0003F88B3D|nr:methyltransferase domain-containing protein [Actinospica robiniae]